MALQAFPVKRVQDPAPVRNLIEITPKNWRRYPAKVQTAAMVTPVYVATVTYTGGVANLGAASPNSGEVGTITSTTASRGQGWMTQAEKAVALGTTMAIDVAKSYSGNGTTRGAIEADERYPSLNTAEVPVAFRSSNYIVPGTP